MRKLVIVLILMCGFFSVIRALDDSIKESSVIDENISVSAQIPS